MRPVGTIRLLLPVLAAAAVGTAAPAAAQASGDGPAPAAVAPLVEGARIPAGPSAKRAWLARVLVPTKVWTSASPPRRYVGKLWTTTPWGGTSQLLVLGVRWDHGNRWLRVRLHGRPNSRAGWIQDDTVKLVDTAWRIEVDRGTRHLRVFNGGRQVRRFRVVVGAPGTPTPTGLFAIADKVRQRDGQAFIGSWALPLTAHSNVLQNFDGGDGQVGLHGRGGASLAQPLGTAASHGCVRLSNAAVDWIAATLPTGTPVRVR